MDPQNIKNLEKPKICEICLKHDPLVKNYAEDFELQTAIRGYIEKQTGEQVNIDDIAHLCDSCYLAVKDMATEKPY
jgi:hypothetical protein